MGTISTWVVCILFVFAIWFLPYILVRHYLNRFLLDSDASLDVESSDQPSLLAVILSSFLEVNGMDVQRKKIRIYLYVFKSLFFFIDNNLGDRIKITSEVANYAPSKTWFA